MELVVSIIKLKKL